MATDRLQMTQIEHGENDNGEMTYMVHTWWRREDGTIISVPDPKGWPTEKRAEAETAALWEADRNA